VIDKLKLILKYRCLYQYQHMFINSFT